MGNNKEKFIIILIMLSFWGLSSLSKSAPEILIIGDSHAFGLSESINETSGMQENITLKGISSSGLVRDDYFNWIEWSSQIERTYDYVFVILGTNDGQNFNNSSSLIFGTREWEIYYSARIEQLLYELSSNKQVFWVAIPPVQSDDFSRKTEYIQAIITEVCLYHHVKVLDVGINIYNGGLYYLQEDGIHLSRKGSDILINSILGEINKITYKRLP